MLHRNHARQNQSKIFTGSFRIIYLFLSTVTRSGGVLSNTRRSEQAGILHFIREMGSALIMALIAIVYVIQAFKIPTCSMEDSLLVGDFLLGLKFMYGAPIVPFSQELGITTRFLQ